MIMKIIAMGIVAALAAMVVKNERPDIAILVSVAGGVAILLSVIDYFTDIFSFFVSLAEQTGIGSTLIAYLLKIIGTGYLIEFACDTVTETGSPGLANKISLAGKVIILCLIIPIIKELIDVVISLLSLS